MRSFIGLILLAFVLALLLAYSRFTSGANISGSHSNRTWLIKKKLLVPCSPTASFSWRDSSLESVPALPGWGHRSWKITTHSDSAQFYFNQGINLYYGFHIIEAEASFKKAAVFDPDCAMAFWGQALAYGPNINDAGFYVENQDAWLAIRKANSFTKNISPEESALIKAQLVHYSPDSPVNRIALNNQYANAMKKVYSRFSLNEEIAVLYADALMNLHPWNFYYQNGNPKSWTPELTSLLEKILKKNPNHPAAVHYYIHALEASNVAFKAIPYARKLDTLMPDVAHMVHMASHIYIRAGMYKDGITSNVKAVEAYQKYVSLFPPSEGNSVLYYLHNVDMGATLATMAGMYELSNNSFRVASENINQYGLPMMETGGGLGEYIQFLFIQPVLNDVRFGKWDSILIHAPIDEKFVHACALWHFARGMAQLKKGDTTAAKMEWEEVTKKIHAPSMELRYGPFNRGADAAQLAANILEGEIALTAGNTYSAIELLKKAVDIEMKMNYNEPADWRIPARHFLGAALLKTGQPAAAEKVYRQDLIKNPNNVWSLKGLEIALRDQQKSIQAKAVAQHFKISSSRADIVINTSAF